MPAVALTDTDGMYAAVPFYQAARAAGVKAIVGVSAFAEATADGEKRKVEVKEVKEKAGARMLLLAMDARGYSNLCQLTTLRHLGVLRAGQETFAEDAGRAVTMEELAEHSAGVIALWPAREFLRRGATEEESERDSIHRRAGRALRPNSGQASPAPTKEILDLKEIFGERLYIEVQRLSAGDGRAVREAQRIGKELGIPLVATNNVHFLKPEEHLHHRAVNAIRTGSLLTTVAPPEITTPEAWFKPAAEMQRLFPDHPEVLRGDAGDCGALQPGTGAGQNDFSGISGAAGRIAIFVFVEAELCGRAETLPAAAPGSAFAADARTGSNREAAPGAVFSAGVGHRGRSAGGAAFRRWRAGPRPVRWSPIAWAFPACARCAGDYISSGS